jgi:predicted ArsR family transcriptional regulator
MAVSVKASHWAWQQALQPTHKVVLLALADHADDAGECWPSIGLLSRKVNVTARTVQRVVRDLQAAGLVGIEPQKRPGGRGATTNRYRLTIDPP